MVRVYRAGIEWEVKRKSILQIYMGLTACSAGVHLFVQDTLKTSSSQCHLFAICTDGALLVEYFWDIASFNAW